MVESTRLGSPKSARAISAIRGARSGGRTGTGLAPHCGRARRATQRAQSPALHVAHRAGKRPGFFRSASATIRISAAARAGTRTVTAMRPCSRCVMRQRACLCAADCVTASPLQITGHHNRFCRAHVPAVSLSRNSTLPASHASISPSTRWQRCARSTAPAPGIACRLPSDRFGNCSNPSDPAALCAVWCA